MCAFGKSRCRSEYTAARTNTTNPGYFAALYGVLFPDNEEAAFSNYRLWESIGFIIAYVLNNVACVRAHTWVVVGFLTAGMAGYFVVEIKERMTSKTFKLDQFM